MTMMHGPGDRTAIIHAYIPTCSRARFSRRAAILTRQLEPDKKCVKTEVAFHNIHLGWMYLSSREIIDCAHFT